MLLAKQLVHFGCGDFPFFAQHIPKSPLAHQSPALSPDGLPQSCHPTTFGSCFMEDLFSSFHSSYVLYSTPNHRIRATYPLPKERHMKRLPLVLAVLCLAAFPVAAEESLSLVKLAPASLEPSDFVRPVTPASLAGSFVPPAPMRLSPRAQFLSPSPTSSRFGSGMFALLPDACPPSAFPASSNDKCFPGPIGPGGKLKVAAYNMFSPLSFLTVAAGAAIAQAADSTPSYGQGWAGYGRRVADRFGSRIVKQFTGTFIAASILKQDPQYDSSRNNGFGPRLGHAIKRVFVTRTDAGGEQFNAWNLIGNAAGAGISQAWIRRPDRGAGQFFGRFAGGLAFDILVNLWREFVVCRNADRK